MSGFYRIKRDDLKKVLYGLLEARTLLSVVSVTERMEGDIEYALEVYDPLIERITALVNDVRGEIDAIEPLVDAQDRFDSRGEEITKPDLRSAPPKKVK